MEYKLHFTFVQPPGNYKRSGRWPWRRKQVFDYIVDFLAEQKTNKNRNNEDSSSAILDSTSYEADDEDAIDDTSDEILEEKNWIGKVFGKI